MFLLEDLRSKVADCQNKENELRGKLGEAKTQEEIAKINEQLDGIIAERSKAAGQIELLEKQAAESGKKSLTANHEDVRSSAQYMADFKEYLRTAKRSDLIMRAGGTAGVSSDLGVLVPVSIQQEVIKDLKNRYGKIYSLVRKLNIPAGVKFAKGEFEANVVWSGDAGTDTEKGVSKEQKGGTASGYVEFTYHIAEVRIAQTLLLSVLASPTFEDEITNAIVKAVLKDWDNMIISGAGGMQPTGILTDISNIPADHVISFTAAEMADWKQFHKKLFAVTTDEFDDAEPVFAMTKATFESNILTLSDKNDRPIAREIPLTEGEGVTRTFNGRPVITTSVSGIKDFEKATNGQTWGLYFVPFLAYAVNGVADFGMRRYFDEDTNQWVTKVLYIADGKPLNESAIYVLNKKVA